MQLYNSGVIFKMIELLEHLGPYTTPLNIVLIFGLCWLARDRARILNTLSAIQRELGEEKDRRAAVMERNYKEFLERGEAMIAVLTDFNNSVRELFKRLNGRGR